MNPRITLLPVCAVLVLSAIGCNKNETAEIKRLRWLEKADPIVDAKHNLSIGDHRLRAVYGLDVSIPGIDRKDFEFYKRGYGINKIEGTTDGPINEEHSRLNELAINYSEAYNRVIITAFKPKATP